LWFAGCLLSAGWRHWIKDAGVESCQGSPWEAGEHLGKGNEEGMLSIMRSIPKNKSLVKSFLRLPDTQYIGEPVNYWRQHLRSN
jgi:hypothetical protein